MIAPEARVEQVSPYGFVVLLTDGSLMPRMLPGHAIVFSRRHAFEYAAAVDRDDAAACHRLICAHGRVLRWQPPAVTG